MALGNKSTAGIVFIILILGVQQWEFYQICQRVVWVNAPIRTKSKQEVLTAPRKLHILQRFCGSSCWRITEIHLCQSLTWLLSTRTWVIFLSRIKHGCANPEALHSSRITESIMCWISFLNVASWACGSGYAWLGAGPKPGSQSMWPFWCG